VDNITVLYDAVKCNLMELTTKSTCVPVVVRGVLICACTRTPCAPGLRYDVLAAFTAIAFTVSVVFLRSMSSSIPPPFPPSFLGYM